ncbi:monocarboxylate transporter 12-like [Glandiceps talaboti]
MAGEGPIHIYQSPDGGYGWVVAACGFGIFLFTPGLTEAFGIFFVKFREYFEVDAQMVSWIVSIMMSMTFFASPVASALSNRFGARPVIFVGAIISSLGLLLSSFATSVPFLYITFGVITGGAYGLVAIPVILLIGWYFQQKHAMGNGIAFAGASFGVVIFPPMCHFMVEHLGWRGALFLISALNMNLCVFAALMRQPPLRKDLPDHVFVQPSEDKKKKGRGKKSSKRKIRPQSKGMDCSLWKRNYLFSIYVIAVFFLGFSTFTPLVHLVPRAVYLGVPHGKAAWIVSVIGITGFIGRITHGIPISRGWVTPYTLFVVTIYMIGVITIAFGPLGFSYARIMIYAVLYGVLSGFYNPMTMVVMKTLVKDTDLPTGMGITLLVYGLGHLVGAPVAGRLYDKTGSYSASFMLAGFTYIISALLLSLKKCCMKCQAGKDAEIEKEKQRQERKERRRLERQEKRAQENEHKEFNLLANLNNQHNNPYVATTAVQMYNDYDDHDRHSYQDSLNDDTKV